MESHEWKRRLEEVTQLAESVFEDQHQAASPQISSRSLKL